jgi:uncharacterized phiE125 gp8 family phage protein
MPVTPAANAITTATDVKSYIKLIGTADDDLIQNIINAVSILFENYCAAKFINQAITEVVDGSGSEIQIVEFCPISALTEIQYYFDTDSPTIMPLTNFKFNAKSGMIRDIYTGFPEGWQNIQIKYTAGIGAAIANLPDDLKLAAMKQCQFFYERDSADFSMTFEEGMIVKAPPEMLSPAVKDMLTPYFRARF